MEEFNLQTETITHDLWLKGQQIDHDGTFIQIDTIFAICFADCTGGKND